MVPTLKRKLNRVWPVCMLRRSLDVTRLSFISCNTTPTKTRSLFEVKHRCSWPRATIKSRSFKHCFATAPRSIRKPRKRRRVYIWLHVWEMSKSFSNCWKPVLMSIARPRMATRVYTSQLKKVTKKLPVCSSITERIWICSPRYRWSLPCSTEFLTASRVSFQRNFSALHICSKYGNIKVANLLLQKGASQDIQGKVSSRLCSDPFGAMSLKNDLTPLHCAVHYNHGNIALLLLQHAASPHVTARNGYSPLHIAAKKNTLDIAETLLEYNANTNGQSSGGFTPLHLSCQDGHSDMTYLLLANQADPNLASKCQLTALHLCAQEDRVKCAEALVNKNANIEAQTSVRVGISLENRSSMDRW